MAVYGRIVNIGYAVSLNTNISLFVELGHAQVQFYVTRVYHYESSAWKVSVAAHIHLLSADTCKNRLLFGFGRAPVPLYHPHVTRDQKH
jgi:hypothetical protein